MSRACDRSVLMPGATAANLPMCHLGEKQLKEALLPRDASIEQVDAFVGRMLDIGVTWHWHWLCFHNKCQFGALY